MRTSVMAAILAACACSGLRAGPLFSFDSPVNVAAKPGETAGWGVAMKSDPTQWIVVWESWFDSESNHIGTYTDLLYDFIPATGVAFAPASGTYYYDFNWDQQTGLGGYTIDPSTPLGATDTVTIRIHYSTFNGDPLTCACRETNHYEYLTGTITATYALPSPEPVPEPRTMFLLAVGLGLIYPLCRNFFPSAVAEITGPSPYSR